MELFELQSAIVKNNIPKILVMTGDEYAIINIYIDQISKVLKRPLTKIDDITKMINVNSSISLIDEKRLYISKYDKNIISKENVWEGLQKKLGDSYLILVFQDVDKRGKFYKAFQSNIVDFGKQDIKTLKTMLKPQINLSDSNLEQLIAGTGFNYGRCLLEIDKMKSYNNYAKENYDDVFKKLCEQKIIRMETGDVIFDFVNKVLERKRSCYEILNSLKENGESNIKIISLLYTAFRSQLIVETVKIASQDTTGLTPYSINACQQRRGRYTIEELRKALEQVTGVEQGIKNGTIEEVVAVDYLLAQVL